MVNALEESAGKTLTAGLLIIRYPETQKTLRGRILEEEYE